MVDPTTMLSEHVSAATFTHSVKGEEQRIDNSLPDALLPAAQAFCTNCFEKMRIVLGGQRINVHSGFRCKILNTAVKGSDTSDHMKANAMDFDCNDRMTLPQAFKIVLQSELRWKQFLLEGVTAARPEGGWLHIAYNTALPDDKQKMEVKIVNFDSGEASYHTVTVAEALAWCDEQK